MESYKLSLVVPVFNEHEVLPQSFARMQSALAGLGCEYEIIYIDDGSSDDTFEVLKDLCCRDKYVKALRFSRNFGHQLAVTAGMDEANGDCLVIIDADLQDPPELIGAMVQKWKEGYEVVYGQRKKREGETVFKKFTAFVYYRLLSMLSPIKIPLDTGDFRLIDKKVAEALRSMREHNRFLRGMSAWAGFKACPVEYLRDERAAGKTKYTLKKMLKLAMDGIIGFSATPLSLAFMLSIGIFAAWGLGLVAMLIVAICGTAIAPWLWAFMGVILLQGFVLFFLGVMGAYVSRTYDEAKGRPLYIVREKVGQMAE